MDNKKIENAAYKMREKILEVSHFCNLSAHIGGALSMVDIMAVLYQSVLNYDPKNPEWECNYIRVI